MKKIIEKLEKLLVAFVEAFSFAYILLFLGYGIYYYVVFHHLLLVFCYGIAILGIEAMLYVVAWAVQTRKWRLREPGILKEGAEHAES